MFYWKEVAAMYNETWTGNGRTGLGAPGLIRGSVDKLRMGIGLPSLTQIARGKAEIVPSKTLLGS